MNHHVSFNFVLQRVINVAADHNVPEQRILDAAGVSKTEAWKPDGLVPTSKLVAAVEAAAELTGLHDFGIRWGQASEDLTYGTLAAVAAHHATLSDALSEAGVYLSQMPIGYYFVFRRSGPGVSLNFKLDAPSDRPPRHFVEGSLVWVVRLARLLSNEQWVPSRIAFTHDQIGTSARYLDAFGCPVEFNQRMNAVLSESDSIDRPISIVENTPIHAMMLKALAGPQADAEQPLPEKILQLLPRLLLNGTATPAHVASLLDMSPRTLQRRLAADGVTFKDIVNRKREAIVGEQVRQGLANGESLAAALGFSKASAASRFIRIYLGKTARDMKLQERRRSTRPVGEQKS
jgi:AraC-like DNA-binding protein